MSYALPGDVIGIVEEVSRVGLRRGMLVRFIVSVVLDSRAGTCQVGKRTIAC